MKSGAMFRTLHYFEDASFFAEHPYIYIYTEDKNLVYEVFLAYETDNSHILNTNDFSTETGYAAYLTKIMSNPDEEKNYRNDVRVTTSDRIITLSTCGSSGSSRRYLVQAVLIDSGTQ
jgi:sortase B